MGQPPLALISLKNVDNRLGCHQPEQPRAAVLQRNNCSVILSRFLRRIRLMRVERSRGFWLSVRESGVRPLVSVPARGGDGHYNAGDLDVGQSGGVRDPAEREAVQRERTRRGIYSIFFSHGQCVSLCP